MANKSMGEIISTLRREKGMTQKEILKMIKVPVNTWKYWVGTFINEDGTKIPVET